MSNALVLWWDEEQQSTYLPSFVGDDAPAAALAVLEPRPLVRCVELAGSVGYSEQSLLNKTSAELK